MCPDFVVVHYVRSQNPTQMRLAPDHDMIQTLAADRSDQPFGKAILPRRGWRGRLVPDAHGAQSTCDDGAINAIPVSDHVAGSPVPRKCLRYLACNPFCRRIPCDVDPDQISAVKADDDKGIEQVEANGWDNQQIHGVNVRRVVTLAKILRHDLNCSFWSRDTSAGIRRRSATIEPHRLEA